ncbi:MAG: nucleoside phosphorylase [Paludibacteraceae bacterium]|nr:nucleoside phosphorylase [Paludibacteraceae bacterium]
MTYGDSELIINPDGTVFHLHLKPEQIADKIILVGDRSRTDMVAALFDSVECTVENREFRTITGTYKGKRVSVLSTGIGTGNIDIVVNELDALANIDLKNRIDKQEHKSLTLVRVGTSGGLQTICPEGTYVASKRSVGFDGVLNFYADTERVRDLDFEAAFVKHTGFDTSHGTPYCAVNDTELLNRIAGDDMVVGNTIASSGFYGPQGRRLRLPLQDETLNSKIESFSYNGEKITNFEMESSALAGLAGMLGHQALTVCLIIANRVGKRFIGDYKPMMRELIATVLDRI